MTFHLQTERKITENKTVRFPLPLIEDIEEVISGTGVSFSGFVIQACQFALAEMEKRDDPVIEESDQT